MTQAKRIQFWRTNLQVAIAFMAELPDEAVNLSCWDNFIAMDKPLAKSCGSIACLGGWLPYIPHFEALGVRADPGSGAPEIIRGFDYADNIYSIYAIAASLFGASHKLFHRADVPQGERLTLQDGKTDRQIAIDRLQYCLAALEADPETYGKNWEGR